MPLIQKELDELKEQMNKDGFWDDIENASRVNKHIKPLEDKINSFNTLTKKFEDVKTLLELSEEEGDEEMLKECEDEITALFAEVEDIRLKSFLSGKYDYCNAILSLHAGAGGTEAQDWVSMLYRMYLRYCEKKGFTVKVLDYLDGDEAGIKSVTFMAEGLNAYGYLRAEKGVHRLVRISPFDAAKRRHTSFASLDVMPEIEDDEDIEINTDDLRIDTYRASGAGGQHINKTDSAIRITHLPTGIVVQCQNERSQIQNKETAMKMLKSKLLDKREEERLKEMKDLKGDVKKIEWGSQIRSYVFHPYSLVKDHRTGTENGNIRAVMDGDIEPFINSYLIMS